MSATSNGNIERILDAKLSSYTTKWYKHFGSAFDFYVDQLNNFSNDSEWALALRLKALHNHLAIALVDGTTPNEAMIDCMLQHFPESKSFGEFNEVAEDVIDERQDVLVINQPGLSVDQFLFHKIEGDNGEIEADSTKTTLTLIGDGVDIQFTFSNKTIKLTVPVADFVKHDGTVPFTAIQTGVAGQATTDLVVYGQTVPFIVQVVYVDPSAGDDATGAINDITLKFETLRAAVDALSSPIGYVIIEEEADVVESQNALDGINNAVIELYIQGAWDSMRFTTTRPFQITSPSLRKFEINRTGGIGAVAVSLSTYSVFCEAWTSSRIKEININVGVVTFNGLLNNHNLIATNGTDVQVNVVCDGIVDGSIGAAREGSGKIKVVVNGDVTPAADSSITASVFEIRDGNHDLDIDVKGVIDITAFIDGRHSVFRSISTASSGSLVVIKGDIVTTTTRTLGLFSFSGNYLTKSFTYSGHITGSGTTSLFYASSAAGDFRPVINLINVNKFLSGPLVTQGGTGDFEVNVVNCKTEGTAFVLSTTADIAYIKISSLYVQGAAAFLLSTNRVDTQAVAIYGVGITVYSTGSAAAELLAAANSTDFIGVGSLTAISTNIASRFDDNKFSIIELDNFETLAGTLDLGNITNGHNIVISDGDKLDFKELIGTIMSFQGGFNFIHASGTFWYEASAIGVGNASAPIASMNSSGQFAGRSIKLDSSDSSSAKYDILRPANTADRELTLPDADIDFSGGSDGQVLTQQADGSWVPEALPVFVETVQGISPTSGDVSPTLDNIADGITRKIYTESEAEDSGVKRGTSFPGSPNDFQQFFRNDIGKMFEYDVSRSKWLSVDTTTLYFTSTVTAETGTGKSCNPSNNTGIGLSGTHTIIGLEGANQNTSFEGVFKIEKGIGTGVLASVTIETADGGFKNNYTLNEDVQDPQILIGRIDVTAANCARGTMILTLKLKAT